MILGPERLFLPDDNAVAVLKLVDGSRSVSEMAASLAEAYDTSVDIIQADIMVMLQGLAETGAVRW